MWDLIEGGEIGQIVSESAHSLMNRFFALEIRKIQDECNRVSSTYRGEWSLRPSTDLMGDYDMPSITFEVGCKELEPTFDLFEPDTVHAKIMDSYCPWNRKTAATTGHSLEDRMNRLITIYLKALEVTDSQIIWIGFSDSFETIINHELLHACGDSPVLRKEVHDGIIRHNKVAKEAITSLSAR